jgi:outer membrane protein
MRILALSLAMTAVLAGAQTPPQKPNVSPIPPTPQLQLPSTGAVIPADATKPLTADDAAAIALQLQPNVTIALANAKIAEAQAREALAGLLPDVSLSAGYQYLTRLGHLGTSTTLSSANASGFSSSITVSQLLFDFNRTYDKVREARASAKASGYSLTAVQANLVYSVKQEFYLVRQDNQLITVNEANVKSNQDQLNLAVAQLSAGLGAPADVVTAYSNLANATVSLTQARSNYLVERVNLAALIGVDPRTPLSLVPDSTEPEVGAGALEDFVNDGLRRRPEVLAAESDILAARFGVSAASKGNLPSLTLSFGPSASGAVNPFANDRASVGLFLNWDLYDGGLAHTQTDAAKAAELSARAALTSTTQQVVTDVSTAYIQLQVAQQQVAVAASAVANAQEGLRLAQGRYKAGVTTFVEVTQAQATLVTAESSQAQAKASLETAKAQMARATGTPVKTPPPGPMTPIVPSKPGK